MNADEPTAAQAKPPSGVSRVIIEMLARYPKGDDGARFGVRALASGLEQLLRLASGEARALRREIAELKRRIDRMEEKGAIRYRGVWQSEEPYAGGDFVTLGGSMWFANVETQARPGTSDDWTLAVKRGRDGRDGR